MIEDQATARREIQRGYFKISSWLIAIWNQPTLTKYDILSIFWAFTFNALQLTEIDRSVDNLTIGSACSKAILAGKCGEFQSIGSMPDF